MGFSLLPILSSSSSRFLLHYLSGSPPFPNVHRSTTTLRHQIQIRRHSPSLPPPHLLPSMPPIQRFVAIDGAAILGRARVASQKSPAMKLEKLLPRPCCMIVSTDEIPAKINKATQVKIRIKNKVPVSNEEDAGFK